MNRYIKNENRNQLPFMPVCLDDMSNQSGGNPRVNGSIVRVILPAITFDFYKK